MADWKTLWERYAELPIETRIKLMQAFRSKSEDELRDLFKREPFAAMLFGKLRDDEVRGLLGPRKPVPMPAPPLPKPVVPEVKKETVEALVDREIRSYSLVHPQTEEFLKVHRNEVLAEALRRVPARVKRDFEEARSRGVSYIEDDAFRSASHEALLVVSEFGEKAKVALPPKPAELPTDKIEALRTVVKVKADDLGLEWSDEVWSRFWHEYEARARELWATKGVTYLEEEVENVLKAVAAPITPPKLRKERVRPPKVEVPVEAPAEVFVAPVTIPRVSISKLPFPRAPSTEEQAILWDAFRYEMARLGQDPYRWRDNFMMHVLNRPYPDWATVLKNFNDFVEAIRTEKPFRLLPLVTLPMPWREEEEQRKYDAILHFIATKLYPSMDELLHGLYTYGVEVTEDDIKKAVKKGFAEKNVWFSSVSKEALESLVGEKL